MSDSPRSAGSWTLLDIVEALGCAVYGPVGDDAELAATAIGDGRDAGVTIDTRHVRPSSVFVALQGSRSHGIEHAKEAFGNGAVAVLVGTDLEIDDERWEQLLGDAAAHGTVLVASDCDGVTALGRLARAWRRIAHWRVVGITGSSGKTSTKDILRAILERAGMDVVASHANWNNEIGVPLTLFAAGANTEVVICEMGMRGLGQIAWLCDVSDPDIGIITTVGTAHLELLGSREAIIAAKAELLAHTWGGGVGIFPATRSDLVEAAERVPDRLLPFGVGSEEANDSAVLVTSLERTETGIAGSIDLMGVDRAFSLPLHGLHHARNFAAAASALVTLVGSASLLAEDALLLDSGDAASTFTSGRGNRRTLGADGIVIDDAYNANPESMRAALDELAAIETGRHARRVAVLGRMAELGPAAGPMHVSVGVYAASHRTIDVLVVIGADVDADALVEGWADARRTSPVIRFDDVEAALRTHATWVTPSDAVLVKASRSSDLGELATRLADVMGGATT